MPVTAPAPSVESRFYTAQQTTVRQAADAVQAAWSDLDPAAPVDSWREQVRPTVVAAVETGQVEAAAPAALYVAAAVQAARAVSAPVSAVVAAAFAGIAATGWPLAALVDLAFGHYRRALAAGLASSDAHAAGLARLLTYTTTEVADAGRLAVQAALLAEPAVAGYERVVRLPACGRCLILAGRLYGTTDAFARHPRCDCQMRPVTHDQWRTGDATNTPDALFNRMTRAQQDAAFGPGDAAAIRAGADMARVVNARGVTPAGGRRRPSGVPTAAQLVAEHTDRTELLAALRRHGYLR